MIFRTIMTYISRIFKTLFYIVTHPISLYSILFYFHFYLFHKTNDYGNEALTIMD